ncbi:MAG: HI0074 family nucleotidyltransferase substrate-binding subunit [Deltaproteobacteria bacterium]
MKETTERRQKSLENIKKAFEELQSYMKEPVRTNRDRAGVIKAFEFTFELFWKLFQKIAQEEGLEAGGPKSSLKRAFQTGLILPDEEDVWISMLDDRNLMTDVYQNELSQQIFTRIKEKYILALKTAFQRLL